MRSVRLDPFSAKLLAIRTGHSNASVRGPQLLDEKPPTDTDAADAADAVDALGLEGAPVGSVMEPSLSIHEGVMVSTGCETCQEHRPISIEELAKQVADLQMRIRSLEDSTHRQDHPEKNATSYR
tara:strand:- start:358 stop:732 length:375 start_codon:yes stop_codon:yes gene_type:complete